MSDHHPRLPGRLASAGLSDTEHHWPVAGSTTLHDAAYLRLRRDTIVDPRGGEHDRLIVQPRGAVAVLAIDARDRVLLIQQYRHAVGRRMLELPAGILDVEGEPPAVAAARELAEEADLAAGTWRELIEVAASPGYSTERVRIFRATELSPVPMLERTEREAEEADLEQWWLSMTDAVDAVLTGRITNAPTVAGILAETARRSRRP